jgi:hypothetical protein
MYIRIALIILALLLFSGCASVPMEGGDKTELAKEFSPPTDGNAGLYIYRSGTFGGALRKDVWVDGVCVGETAPNVFFYKEVKGDTEHKISTESEFSPNDLLIRTKSGNNYFIRQYIKMGVFVGGANLELVNEAEGKKSVIGLEMAKMGVCSGN